MAKKPDLAPRIVDAALALAARQGWARTSLADIAAEAGLPLLEVYRQFGSKPAIFAAFLGRIDRAVLAGESEPGEKPRDRLFDTLMRRFDALHPHKEAVRAMLRDGPADPLGTLFAAPAFLRSIGWMLEASGIDSSGLRGGLRTHLVAAIYLSVMRTWLGDDTADLMKTMAALDRRLKAAEGVLGLNSFVAAQKPLDTSA
jgi:AcrR family transcriptional regulator